MNDNFQKACKHYYLEGINFKKAQNEFKLSIQRFMRVNYNIPIKVYFFGNNFGIDIHHSYDIFDKAPYRLPLDVLVAICDEFGCEFLETCCDGSRWLFRFDSPCGH